MRHQEQTIRLTILCLTLWAAGTVRGASGILFQDNFGTPGIKLNTAAWTTEVGASSYLGRTQLADWVSQGGAGQFVVGTSGAQLTLNTYNPTGFSLYGTHAKTLLSFQPSAASTLEFTTRLQLASLQPGIVYGMYLYGCPPTSCAARHDEIDIEIVTNALQGAPLQVELNRYANEPLGAGNGGLVNLPSGFDPLAVHDWTIRWSLAQIDYLVDGTLLLSATTHVPQGAMQVNEIAWGPDNTWAAAFSSSLQPANTSGQNRSYTALLTSVTVSASHPAFFAGEGAVSGSLYFLQFPNSNLFGYYGYLSGGWIFHIDMGYEYVAPGNGPEAYMFDLGSGHWWYTSSSLFPYLYDFSLNAWIYYFPDSRNPGRYTTNPRTFANLTTGKSFTM